MTLLVGERVIMSRYTIGVSELVMIPKSHHQALMILVKYLD